MRDSKFIGLIAEDSGLDTSVVERLVKRAPYTYKSYHIRKRTAGFREISQPARETKYIQKWLVRRLIEVLPVHDSATAYKQGSSIAQNARRHVSNAFLVKMDFRNFFPSIKEQDVIQLLSDNCGDSWSHDDIELAARVFSISKRSDRPKCLSIGAPSSPFISNAMMYEFDKKISNWAMQNGFAYTRYADDLTFSTNQKGASEGVEGAVRSVIAELAYPRLRVNNSKTVHLSKKNRRNVTGLILTNDGAVSLGRHKKRELRAMIHKYQVGELDEAQVFSLQGYLAYANDVEPDFVTRMSRKYGDEIILRLFKKRM